jgi:anaerobic magnesium-protoporphyrin IX monomethyl ester cyclase
MWGTRWVSRDPGKVLAEMLAYREQYKIDNFDFYDLTAIVKKDWIVRFCNMVIDSGVAFTWQLPSGTRSEAIDSEVSELLYKSGCRNMSYAPESGAPSVLRRIKKKIDLRAMEKSMSASIRNGINCKANIIIGFPGETHGEILQTLWFCVRMAALGLHDMSISPFSPYPGSELFSDMSKARGNCDLSDKFFYGLAAYTDLTKTVSCSEHVGNRALGLYRIFGMLLFYAVLYMIRPWRLIRTVCNVFGKQQESRLEMSLRDLYVRLVKSKESGEAPAR